MSNPIQVLIVRAGSRRCAFMASDVVETMRPLPVRPLGQAPAFVRGISVIRGLPVPVVDLAGLLESGAETGASRFVSLRVEERRVALAVEEVIGLRRLEFSTMEQLPPLLNGGAEGAIAAVGTLDSQLLLLLSAARLIPEEAWKTWAMPQV